MQFVPMNCPNCGAPLVERGGSFACEHCGCILVSIADGALAADAEQLSLAEFEKQLQASRRTFPINMGDQPAGMDVDAVLLRERLKRAGQLLSAGEYDAVYDVLQNVPEDVFAAERARLLADCRAEDEIRLAAQRGDITRSPHYARVLALADGETRATYERIAAVCMENERIAAEIGKGMELVELGAAEEALTYARQMLKRYPTHAEAWELIIAAKCIEDGKYSPEEDLRRMSKCPNFPYLYSMREEDGHIFAFHNNRVIQARLEEAEQARFRKKSALSKYLVGPALLLGTLALSFGLWKLFDLLF